MAEPVRPDVIVFVWDTCRGDHTSPCGAATGRTPTLEALAREGVAWTTAIAPSSWTAPSHASLFTGLLPESHRLTSPRESRVRDDVPVLAEHLESIGYESVLVTANPLLMDRLGLTRGFSTAVPAWTAQDTYCGTGTRVRECVRSLLDARRRREERRPLFLVVNLMDTHMPYRPDPGTVDPMDGGRSDASLETGFSLGAADAFAFSLGLRTLDERQVAGVRAVYAAAVRQVDRVTGAILDDLREYLPLDRAFIAITADHGESLAEHGLLEHHFSMYESVLRIPLVVRWPDRRDAGRREDALVSLIDLAPTILEVAGTEPFPTDRGAGRSLALPPLRERVVLAQYSPPIHLLGFARREVPQAGIEDFEKFRVGIRTAHESTADGRLWKLIQWTESGPRGRPRVLRRALFDLRADPGEELDLLEGTPPEIVQARARRLAGLIR